MNAMQNTPNVTDVLIKLLSTVKSAVEDALNELGDTPIMSGSSSFVKTGERGKVSFINEEASENHPSPFTQPAEKQMQEESAIPSFTSQPAPESSMTPQEPVSEQQQPVQQSPIEEPSAEDPIAAFSSEPEPQAAFTPQPESQPEPEPQPMPEETQQAPAQEDAPMTRQEFEKMYTEAWGKIWAESGGNLEKAKKSLAEWIEPFKVSQPQLFDDTGAQASQKVA